MKHTTHHLFTTLCGFGLWFGLAIGTNAQGASLGIRMVPELTLTGTIGTSNLIQYVDVLRNPEDWKTLTTVVLKVSPYVLHDSNAPASERRFYRAINLGAGTGTNQPPGSPQNMVWVAPGSFTMGSPDTDPDRTDFEIPQHKVVFTYGYWIGKYEVTQAQYEEVTGGNPSSYTEDPTLPVDSVTWNDATNYCAQLTEKSRKSGNLPPGYAYRLPTEAEWECAARAGKTTRFSFGDDLDYSKIDGYAWTSINSEDGTQPVGRKTGNAWGLYDIYGNVAEWCQDWFDMYNAEDSVNPKGPAAGNDRVYRGGSWGNGPEDSRAAARGGLSPNSRLSSFGFRVVLAPTAQ